MNIEKKKKMLKILIRFMIAIYFHDYIHKCCKEVLNVDEIEFLDGYFRYKKVNSKRWSKYWFTDCLGKVVLL